MLKIIRMEFQHTLAKEEIKLKSLNGILKTV